jgi:hypothetical protein
MQSYRERRLGAVHAADNVQPHGTIEDHIDHQTLLPFCKAPAACSRALLKQGNWLPEHHFT